jgi:hypothetical protein
MAKTTGIVTAVAIKEETTKGTLIVPAGTDYLPIVADPGLQQLKNVAESLERVNSYSLVDVLDLRYEAGQHNLNFYMKRTGTNDTAVAAVDTAMKVGLGRKTTNAGTNITYNLSRTTDTLLTMSIFCRIGGIGMQCAGAFINDMQFPIEASPSETAIFRCTTSGEFYRLYWAGQTTITEDLSATNVALTQFKVAAADLAPSDHATAAVAIAGKFTIGAYVMVGALTTSHKITAINPTTGVVTVTPAFGSNQASGSTVRDFMPAATITGTPISGHKGVMTYDSNNFTAVLAGNVHITMPRRALVEEKNNTDYAIDDAWEGRRTVMIEGLRAYFDPTGTPKQDLFFALSHRNTKKSIVIPIGNEAGLIWEMTMANCITKEPKLSGEGLIELDMVQAALASSSLDDEFVLVSK